MSVFIGFHKLFHLYSQIPKQEIWCEWREPCVGKNCPESINKVTQMLWRTCACLPVFWVELSQWSRKLLRSRSLIWAPEFTRSSCSKDNSAIKSCKDWAKEHVIFSLLCEKSKPSAIRKLELHSSIPRVCLCFVWFFKPKFLLCNYQGPVVAVISSLPLHSFPCQTQFLIAACNNCDVESCAMQMNILSMCNCLL